MKSNGVCTDAPPLRSAPEGEQPRQSRGKPEVFAGVLAILLATGWAANHFAALIPAISDAQHLSASLLDAIFGIYAVGLLPGLLLGGRASDAFGRPSIALTGAATVLAGTIPMLLSQQSDVLLAGRLVVGVGVGLAMSSCTAWASDLNGPPGAAVAGAVLIAGFAVGPFVSGVITAVCPSAIGVSFATAAGLVGTAIVVVALALRRSASPGPVRGRPAGPGEGQSTGLALSWAMPLAPWVFASATLAFVTIPTRIHTGLAATMVAGIAFDHQRSERYQSVGRPGAAVGSASRDRRCVACRARLRHSGRGTAEYSRGSGIVAAGAARLCIRTVSSRRSHRLGSRSATTQSGRADGRFLRGDLHWLRIAATTDRDRVVCCVGRACRPGSAGDGRRGRPGAAATPKPAPPKLIWTLPAKIVVKLRPVRSLGESRTGRWRSKRRCRSGHRGRRVPSTRWLRRLRCNA